MNIEQILRDLGLQDRASLLRSKKVTSSTFREMDGSAKQIIRMSESLGLSAEEVVKIKAAIEEKTLMAVETVGSSEHHVQHPKGYASHGQMGVPFSSRQVPNARSKESKAMQWNQGQMVFGQKGGLMKQEKVILDYGRKNRLSKLVQGGQGLVQPSQNLARKSTHQLSMSMNQFLNQHGQHQQPKLRNSSTVQQPNQIRSKYGDGAEQRPGSKSRSPEMGGMSHQQPLKVSNDSCSHTENQMSASAAMAGQKPAPAVHRQASVNSDSRQQQAKPSSSHQASQQQTASFGASYPNQVSSGPPSSTVHNQHPRRMSGVMQAPNIEQDMLKNAPVSNMAHANNQYFKDGRETTNYQGFNNVQENNSSDLHSRIKPESHQPSNNAREHQFARKDHQDQYDEEVVDQNGKEQAHVQHQKRPATTMDYMDNGEMSKHHDQQQYQDLGNRQSQEYLSEKLDKLCSQQEANNRPSQSASQANHKNQYSESQDEDDQPAAGNVLDNVDLDEGRRELHAANQAQPNFVGSDRTYTGPSVKQSNFEESKPQVDLALQKQSSSGLNHKATHQNGFYGAGCSSIAPQPEQSNQRDQQIHDQQNNQAVEQERQYAGNQEESPSASDLEDPRYDEECDDNHQDDAYGGAQFAKDQNQAAVATYQRQEEEVEQSEDGPLGADDESNSKLSELQHPQPITHAPAQQVAQPVPQQHHSRPTIGMKQPAQHYLPRLEMANAPDDAGTIPSGSSSPRGIPPAMVQPLMGSQSNQQYASEPKITNQHQEDNDMQSDSEDEEEDSEFLHKASPQPLTHEQQMPQQEQQNARKADDSEKGDMADDAEDDDKSMEDNYDEEEMPEDTDYKRRVQLLHENRQKNAQHMWGARAPAGSEQLSASALNNAQQIASRNSLNEQAPKQEVANAQLESSEDSSELSDTDQQPMQQEQQIAEKDKAYRVNQHQSYTSENLQSYEKQVVQTQLSQNTNMAAQQRHQYTQQQSQTSQHDQQKQQKSQQSIIQQQLSQSNNHQQYSKSLNHQQQASAYHQAPADEPFIMATSNNHCSHSSQNTFLDVAGGGETGGQVSKHSSLAHSLHRQQLQNSQQASLRQQQANQASSHHQILSQNSGQIRDYRQETAVNGTNANANAVNVNQCTISQQSSFQSNMREPHHLLIENDERSLAVNHPHAVHQAHPPLHVQQAHAPQPQPNNQEMFEQLRNHLKVQSQNSAFNLNLTQVQAQAHNSASSAEAMINQRPQSNSAFTPPPKKQEQQINTNIGPGHYLQPEQSSARDEFLKRNSRVNSSHLQSQSIAQPLGSNSHLQNQKPPAQQSVQRGLQAAHSSRNASASPHSPQQVAQSQVRASSNSTLSILKVNKETSAQPELMDAWMQSRDKKLVEDTTAEVTDRVSREVRMKVTEEVTRRVTPEVTQRVKAETEQVLSRKHQLELQDLKDQYEESAQQQLRREEKLNHQIGKLEGQVSDASKQLEEKRMQQVRLQEQVSQLQGNISTLNKQIQRKNEELQMAMDEKESAQQEHSAAVQRLVGETHQANAAKADLTMKVQHQLQQLDEDQVQISQLQREIASQLDALTAEKQRLAAREAELQNMQSNLIEKESQVTLLTQHLEEVKAQCLQAQQERQSCEERLTAECNQTREQLKEQIEEMKRERAKGEQEKAQLQKQLEEAQLQKQRALDREATLIKKQRAQSELPRQVQNTTPAQQQPAPRSLTPTTGQTHTNKQVQPCSVFPSAPTEKQGVPRTVTATATPPQAFKLQPDTTTSIMSASIEQSQKELQLKQERLHQLIQLQMKQDELIKLEQALKTSKQKVPSAASPNMQQKVQAQEQSGTTAQAPLKPYHGQQIDDVEQQPTPKTPQTLVGNDLLLQRSEVGAKHPQALSQQADNAAALGDRMNGVGTPQQPRGKSASFAHSVDYIDDEQDDQVDQEQDGDQDLMMYNSGSKNKMHNVKEESSYLPDCAPPEKPEKKKVVKKVRFHDDEQLIDSPYKSSSRQTHNQQGSQSSQGMAQATGATSMAGNAQIGVGKKRLRQEAADLNGEHIILSQEILSGSLGHDGSSQQMDRYEEIEQEIEMIGEIGGRKTQEALLDQVHGHLPSSGYQGVYKRQRMLGDEQQNARDSQQIKEVAGNSQVDLDDGDVPVRASGPRLRRKANKSDLVEFNGNTLMSGDDNVTEGNGRQQRKRRKAGAGRGVHAGTGPRSVSPAPDAQAHLQHPGQGFQDGPQNLSGQNQRTTGKGRAHQGPGPAAQSNSLEQKMKQQVNSIDQQYLKKNPNLLNMIQRIARK